MHDKQSFACYSLPDKVPHRKPGWFGRLCRWWLDKRGWQIDGQMANQPKMVLAVAPHTSNWDFIIGVAVMFALGIRLSFFGKHTIFTPPLGYFMRKIGGIPVERSQAHGVVQSIAKQINNAHELVLALAPEGTRKAVFPWKSGFLYIAQTARIPIQCVGLDYRRKALVFGPVLTVSDDLASSMDAIYSFYRTIDAKYPQQTVTEPNA